jgi:hypothetical protein
VSAAAPQPASPPLKSAARRFALSVVGIEANPDKRHRCREAIAELGGHLDRDAPVSATLYLGPQNSLRIRSRTRGVVMSERLPPWIIPDLCREVMLQARRAIAEEPPSPAQSAS